MITVFNRKELFSTYSMSKQSEIRNILSNSKIDYRIKTIKRNSSSPLSTGSRARTGAFCENLDLAYEYIIYVKKQDFEQAMHLIKLCR